MFSKLLTIHIRRHLRSQAKKDVGLIGKGKARENAFLPPILEEQLEHLKERNNQFKTELGRRPGRELSAEELEAKSHLKPKKEKRKPITLKELAMINPLDGEINAENQFEKLAMAVTPLYKMPYHKQLKMKQAHAIDVLRNIRKRLKEVKAPIFSTVNKLPCPMEELYPSPDILSYRNKDEFSVNIGVDGNPKTVGYYIGVPNDPSMKCVEPTHLINIRDSHKLVARHFQNCIRNSSYDTCIDFSKGGVWRNITVRSTLKGELMAVINIYSKELQPDVKDEIKDYLKQYFFQGPGAECGLSSLYLQACPHTRCSRETAPYELIEGKTHITEECLGKSFKISPDSFFQINIAACEVLYDTIRKVSEVSKLSTVLDVCCGTGAVSVILSPHIRGAIGIDVVSGAIEDAKLNALNNNATNTNFIHGRVEKMLPILMQDLQDCTEVVAVVNPSRGGLHPSVLESLRQCESIKKLVFVTCKPEGIVTGNMTMLGSTLPRRSTADNKWSKNPSKKSHFSSESNPFIPRYVVSLDMFPHTLHLEYVFLFERVYFN